MVEPPDGYVKCPHCGASIQDSARFCVECGKPLEPQKSMRVDRPATSTRGGPQTARGAGTIPGMRTTGANPVASTRSGAAQNPTRSAAPQPRRTLKLDIGATVGAPLESERAKAPTDLSAASMSEALAEIAGGGNAPGAPPIATDVVASPVAGPPIAAQPKPPLGSDGEPVPISAILADIDTTFDNILEDPASVPQETSADDIATAQTLFKQITAAYIGPVRDFMIELRMGEPSKDWIQVCAPALGSLKASATRMGIDALAAALGELESTLEIADKAPGESIAGDMRERLIMTSEGLVTLLPDAFAVQEERDRREPIIVRSLLCQVSGVRKVQLDRIYRAGLTSLGMFYVAKPRELADATGLAVELSGEIVARFSRYKQQAATAPADAARSTELARLRELARTLGELNDAYDQRGGRSAPALDKKRARQLRTDTMHAINLVLARLGEVELVSTLERLPFQKKAEELDRFLTRRSTPPAVPASSRKGKK
jgi:hypothetical protein